MTEHSAGADLRSGVAAEILPGQVAAISTGVWIDRVDWEKVPAGKIPELQIRARSGLAWKHKVALANGVGTIDADYPDEIKVLLINHGTETFVVQKGERIAQILLQFVERIPDLAIGGERSAGFGSTGKA